MSSITDLPAGERPRERLNALGPEALTGRELMALLVGSGGRGGSALGIADDVLAGVAGSLRTLGSVSPSAIAAIPGVGMATAARIAAALELGRRASEEIRHPRERVRGPRDVFDRMEPRLRDLPQEEFHALLLSARHNVIAEVFLTRGILDASLIHPRSVSPRIAAALELGRFECFARRSPRVRRPSSWFTTIPPEIPRHRQRTVRSPSSSVRWVALWGFRWWTTS